MSDESTPANADASDSLPSESDGATDRRDGADTRDGRDTDCEFEAGPKSVRRGSYCIDSTEVTNEDYQAYLTAKKGDTRDPLPECDGVALEPGNWPQTPPNAPVTQVSWCNAHAYCVWAGKRLCGHIGGGPLDGGTMITAESQWFAACSHDDDKLHAFPYGATYDASACVTEADAVAPVRSRPGCEGSYPGIFDLSGNVAEFDDSCSVDEAGARTFCLARGGSYASSYAATCTSRNASFAVQTRGGPNIGFRCCGP